MTKQVKHAKGIDSVYSSIKEILDTARSAAYRAVNFAMVQAYWHIGRVIVEDEQKGKKKADYGEYLVRELAQRLTKEFGKGFTLSNIKYCRQFYLSFSIGHAVRGQSQELIHESPQKTKSHALCDELPIVRNELSWTHYRLLLKVERPDVRQFYMDECILYNWSTRQLERQINSFYYERILSSRNKKNVRAEIKKLEPSTAPNDIIKDPYVLEFLGLKENKDYLESSLEQGLMDKLHDFLLGLGKGFSFVARQKSKKSVKEVSTHIHNKVKRKNIATAELQDFVKEDETKSKKGLCSSDPSLDPQLVWKGKDEMINLKPACALA